MRKFLSLPPAGRRLLLEAFVYLGWARILKAMPFARIAPCLGTQRKETAMRCHPSEEKVIKDIAQAIRIMSRHTAWESRCLVRAIAAKKMLERRRIESTLYLGTARDESGNMIAHAWLRSGPFYVTGAEEMGMFTTVAVFGTEIKSKRN